MLDIRQSGLLTKACYKYKAFANVYTRMKNAIVPKLSQESQYLIESAVNAAQYDWDIFDSVAFTNISTSLSSF